MTLDAPLEVVTDFPGRSWTLRHEGMRPLTLNRVADLHRQRWAAYTKAERWTWCTLAKQAKVPRGLARVRVVVTPLHADSRSPQDVAACAPAAKAAIDGLVDAGVIHDDGPEIVVAVEFRPPLICGHDGLQIELQEVH